MSQCNRRRKSTRAKLKRVKKMHNRLPKGFSPQPNYITNFGVKTGRVVDSKLI